MQDTDWAALYLGVVAALMMLPSIIDRARRNKIRRNKR